MIWNIVLTVLGVITLLILLLIICTILAGIYVGLKRAFKKKPPVVIPSDEEVLKQAGAFADTTYKPDFIFGLARNDAFNVGVQLALALKNGESVDDFKRTDIQ